MKELLDQIIENTGYVKELKAEGTEEAIGRIENIEELLSKAADYDASAKEPSLGGFLQEVALVADIDNLEENDDRVVLMTLHSAKGLEFPYVYMVGMEDGMFPGYMAANSDDPTDLEEERRLCYVGITRAMKHLTLTCAKQRKVRGETQYNRISRFIEEIPRELLTFANVQTPKKESSAAREPVKNAYQQAKEIFQTKAFDPSQFKIKKQDQLDYGVGDTVRHMKYGVGMVEKIMDGGKDFEVTVNFEKFGVKKMFAAFAKLKKI